MPVPHKARRDSNEDEIIDALMKAFAGDISIDKISDRNVPDLAVNYRGRTLWMEIKTKSGKPREGQLLWALRCKGENYIINNSQDAILAVQGQLLSNAPAPLFPVNQSVTVSPENGWRRFIFARKFLLSEWLYLLEADEVLSEIELQSLV